MLAVDLLAWAQTILPHDQSTLAKAEPKTAALPAPAVVLSARLNRYYGRLRRHPAPAHFPA